MPSDPRCFINASGTLCLVRDLEPGSFQIRDEKDWVAIDLLEKDQDEMLVADTYVLHADEATLRGLQDEWADEVIDQVLAEESK